jgi:ribosomal protein S27E
LFTMTCPECNKENCITVITPLKIIDKNCICGNMLVKSDRGKMAFANRLKINEHSPTR